MVVQLRVEDRLQGAQNFPTWKEKITRILDVSDVEEHIDSTKVAPTDPIDQFTEPGKIEPLRITEQIFKVYANAKNSTLHPIQDDQRSSRI